MIRCEDCDGIRIARMEHGKANALDVEFVTALNDFLDAAKRDPVNAVVLAGAGTIFSAGVDLHRLLDGGEAYLRAFVPLLDLAFEKCLRLPKPLVAAINGHAIAGGGVLACVSDYRVFPSERAKIGVPEMIVGVPFPPLALEAVRATVAAPDLRRVVLLGELLSGDEALRSGLVDEVVEQSLVEVRATEVAKRLAEIPAATFAQHKQDWRRPILEAATVDALESVTRVWCDPATVAAISSYVEKTLGKR